MMEFGQFSATFNSINEMSEKTGFDLNFCQLEAGEPILKAKTTILPSVINTKYYFNKAFHQRGIAPDGYLTFGLAQGSSIFRYSGKEIGSTHLIDFNARSGFDLKSEKHFSAQALQINVDRLYSYAQAYDVDLSGLGENDFAAPKLIDPIKLRQLLVAVQNMEKLVLILENQPQGKIEIATVEDAIFRILVDCLDSSQRNNSLPYSNRLVVRRRVLDYIQSHVREVITINELCRACATTSRTLERVFREEFSVTPKRYLTLLKLSGIRHELCQLNQEKSIRDIAISWGFWHMSQFAQDYKNHYGELPSQTRQSNLGSTKKA